MAVRRLEEESARKTVPEEVTAQYVQRLKRMIDCKTVFTGELRYKEEFEHFYHVLEQEFPLLHENAERLTFGTGCFVYRISGKNAKKNVMLMSHHDVVEAAEGWSTDPFCAVEHDGALWGRGTIDTKTPLFAQLQAYEELLAEGYDFEGINLYLGSSDNEETGGDGIVLAAQYFREHQIHFEVVLDEGGAITTGMIPGVSAKSAMVAVHEKSRHVYKCTATLQSGGHGSLNGNTDNALARMSQFICEVNQAKIYSGHFYPEVRETFTRHAPYMAFPMKLLFGNFTLFGPLIKKIMLKMPQTQAMLATGISFNSLFAGSPEDPQIKAGEANATMVLRCIREEDLLKGLEKIRSIGAQYGVEIKEVLRDYCEPTDFYDRPYRILEEVLNESFPDVIVAPFLLTAGTDARRLSGLADSILRFAPIDLDKQQFASIHGADEHIKVKNIGECVGFYKSFVRKIAL